MRINISKNYFSVFKFAAVAAALSFTSCDKDDDKVVENKQNITEIVVANPNFSVLKSAVVKADLATTLSGTGPFTVFAPDDNAFKASGIDNSTISTLPAEQLKTILLYHTIPAKVLSSQVPAGPNAAVKTAADMDVFVTRNDKGVFVNGLKVNTADIMATNGVIHTLEKVLMPPTGNIVATAQANPDFSFLVAAVLRASQGSTNVAAILSGDSPLTVFAPTNQAFKNAGFATIESIQAADPAVLTEILTYHVVGARAFSSDLVDGQSIPTANTGKAITVGLINGATVKGIGNAQASKIVATNLMATNGVIHVIDSVLLPNK